MSHENLVGKTIGQYDLRELVGHGGMGAVYRAYQRNLAREVAVKVLLTLHTETGEILARFNREAHVAASLEHRHIIPIYDYGVEGGMSYIVMRLLGGGTLSERLYQNRQPSLAETDTVLRQLASALDYAHARDIIHRDLKPSNIMFDTEETAYLVDFGIAKILDATNALTASGMVTGTPAFMAPEMWTGAEITPAVDLYALGVLTYAVVTGGKMPFEAQTPYALMNKHLNEPPTPPHQYRANLPSGIVEVLQKAMAKKPQDRYATATAFAEAFASAAADASRESPTGFFKAPAKYTTTPLPRSTPTPAHDETAVDPQPPPAREVAAPVLAPDHNLNVPTTQERQVAHEPQLAEASSVELRPKPAQSSRSRPGALVAALALVGVGVLVVVLALRGAGTITPAAAPTATVASAITQAPAAAASVVTQATVTLAPNVTPSLIPTPQRLAELNNRANWVTSIAFSPDGKSILTASSDGRVRDWDVALTGLIDELDPKAGSILSVAFHPSGLTFASGDADGSIHLYLAPGTELDGTLKGHTGAVLDIAYRPDGKELASGAQDGTIRLWNLDTLAETHTLDNHGAAVLSVAYSPDGKKLASGDVNGMVRLWDVATGKQLNAMSGHEGAVWSVTFNPAGDTIASASEDHTARLWDVASGTLLNTLRGHTAAVYSVAYAPDGTLLATGSADRTIQIWDAASGAKLGLVISHESAVLAVAWHPDNQRLASGGEDGTWRVWTVRGDVNPAATATTDVQGNG